MTTRVYGSSPYRVVVVHGGPGAPGTMAPLAKELARRYGVLEPLLTEDSMMGQVEELARVIEEKGFWPVVLIGHSFGAWLSYIVAALYPERVNLLLLVGSGSFEEKYVSTMRKNRERRCTSKERLRIEELMDLWKSCTLERKKEIFKEFGRLMTRIETYRPINEEMNVLEYQPDLFEKLMVEAHSMRRSGQLLEYGERIISPVMAIHGDWDCHPYQGVKDPLSRVVKDFSLILLEKCGHYPWNEVEAKDTFFNILWNRLENKGNQ